MTRRSLEISTAAMTAVALAPSVSGCTVLSSGVDARCAVPTVTTTDIESAARHIAGALNTCAQVLPASRRVVEPRPVNSRSSFALGIKTPIGEGGVMVIEEVSSAQLPSGLPDPDHITRVSATEFAGRKGANPYAWLLLEQEPPKGTTWGITWAQKAPPAARMDARNSVAELSAGTFTSEGNTETPTPARTAALTTQALDQLVRWAGVRPGKEPLPLQVPAPMPDDTGMSLPNSGQ